MFMFIGFEIGLISGRPLFTRGGASTTSEVFPRFDILIYNEAP